MEVFAPADNTVYPLSVKNSSSLLLSATVEWCHPMMTDMAEGKPTVAQCSLVVCGAVPCTAWADLSKPIASQNMRRRISASIAPMPM
jgi:hypothetical protein